MSTTQLLPRRTFLRGLGTAMALPWLEAMMPRTHAAEQQSPVRLGFLFFPNGAIMPRWKPEGDGTHWELSPTLQPLEEHKSDISVFTGLTQHHGRANGDGAGDHARCAGSYLTGAQPFKTAGANIRVGQSADQAAAEHIGHKTRLPSLELGIERGRSSGNCDSGYSCVYSSTISWKSATTPMAKEINPKLAFERLFRSDASGDGQQRARRRQASMLDLVAEDAAILRQRLGQTDRRKLDEYLTSVRELERRVATSEAQDPPPGYTVPEGIPSEVDEHIRLMYDIIALAFQTDTTRICSFMLGNAGSNRAYRNIGVNGGHHSLSHHQNDAGKIDDLAKIDRYLVDKFADFLARLKSIREGDNSLLDSCLIVYGSGIADANRHTHHDLPVILAGRGGRRIETGQLRDFAQDTPLNNLFLSMCHAAGAQVSQLGDSTGPLLA